LFALLTLWANRADGDELPAKQLTLDVDAASIAVTYAWRARPQLMFGFGAGAGPSPVLGVIATTSDHYDPSPDTVLLELLALQGFARWQATSWLRTDVGLRAGVFAHGRENFQGGPFVMAFVAPAVGKRWFWIGPRLAAGGLTEEQDGGESWALVLDALIARFAISW
jgi:hypothetical protein